MPAALADPTATLLVSCPDRRGIVATLAQVLHGHGANILEANYFGPHTWTETLGRHTISGHKRVPIF